MFRFVWSAVSLGVVLSAAAGPKVELVGAVSADFGQYPARQKQEARFKLHNGGDAPFEITRLRKTCGCFEVRCEPMQVPPGQDATVCVSVLPDSIHQAFTRSVFVETSDPAASCLRLDISGHAVPLVDIKPSAKLAAGTIPANATWRQDFALVPSEPGVEFGPAEVTGTHPLTAALTQDPTQPGQYRLNVAATAIPLAAGVFRCVITLPVLKPAGAAAVEVVVYGEVYDVRGGKHLGKTNDWEVAVAEGETKLFALLPEALGGVNIAAPTGTLRPGARCEFRVGLKATGTTTGVHTFTVAVTDAQGRIRPEYGQVLATNDKGDAAAGAVPLALNDPTGKWQIAATETVTKATAAAAFVVAPAP